ncbi:ATP-dependent zinc protease [Altericroceibacterium spongiae]|uniref:ATP-dependent zinc protease n=1 Tax=Altericroceibacterium spongiae TaxID=2320269 RepID=A0A420EE42_9SPHN|nr:ATP-dependent zinc protease [Altericroceibacterium spongiae]RKF18967.1 ATP-dependent zinc protease [Altericroceibacterium spongiae]
MTHKPGAGMTLIGWREYAGLPAFGIRHLPAKIDTGARTSSLHATDIALFQREGEPWVRFRLEDGQGEAFCEAPHVARRVITSSNGQTQERLIVKTDLQLGPERFRAEFSLADRSDMQFPLLIGRTALRRRFQVDPGRSFLLSDLAMAQEDPFQSSVS